MLRRVGSKGLSAVGGRLGLPLLLAATVFFVVLPVVDERKIYLSEGNVKPISTPATKAADLATPNPFSKLFFEGGKDAIVVRGRRSPGGTLLTVAVNSDSPTSMFIAGALYNSFQSHRSTILSGDLEFRFFSRRQQSRNASRRAIPTLEEVSWRVPSEVEVALVLDIAEIVTATTAARQHVVQLCLNVFGSDGLQPNMDIVNLMTFLGHKFQVEWDFLCQQPQLSAASEDAATMTAVSVDGIAATLRSVMSTVTQGAVTLGDADARKLIHYGLSLVTAATTGSSPQFGGASLRRRGMHPIVLSSRRHDASEWNAATQDESFSSHVAVPHNQLLPVVSAVEGLIRGVNNLDERLHHSFPVYLHVGQTSFVDFEVAQHIVFLVLGALGSDMFASFQSIAATLGATKSGGGVSEWSVLFGIHSMRAVLKLFTVLTLSCAAVLVSCARSSTLNNNIVAFIVLPVVEVVSTTAADLGIVLPPMMVTYYATIGAWLASVPMFLSRTFLPLSIVAWAVTAKALSRIVRRRSPSPLAVSVGASSLVMGIWNSVVVCLLLAYHPLLALPGSLVIGWQQVWTSLCSRQRCTALSPPASPLSPPVKLSKLASVAGKLFRMFRRVISLRLGVALSLASFFAAEGILVINAASRGVTFPSPSDLAHHGNAADGFSYEMVSDVNSIFAIFGVAANVWWFLLSAI